MLPSEKAVMFKTIENKRIKRMNLANLLKDISTSTIIITEVNMCI